MQIFHRATFAWLLTIFIKYVDMFDNFYFGY